MAGKISAHKAMVVAGFKDPEITLPVHPAKAARLLRKHFQGDALAALIKFLSARTAALPGLPPPRVT